MKNTGQRGNTDGGPMRKRRSKAAIHGAHTVAGPNNIARAVVVKDEELFLVCEPSGDIPLGNDQGFGMYYHDCRFLNGYELTISGSPANALEASSEHGFMAEFVLTNPDLKQSGGTTIKKQSLGINWQRIIQASQLSLEDVITCTNYTEQAFELLLSFSFEAGFEDVFEVRGLHPVKTGKVKEPRWRGGNLLFEYDGADGLYRSLAIKIVPPPKTRSPNGVGLNVALGPNESKQVRLTLLLSESSHKKAVIPKARSKPETKPLTARLLRGSDDWVRNHCQMRSSDRLSNNVFERSMRDLKILKTSLEGHEYFSAGLPWYGALFGRDSLISSLQTLAFRPDIAEQTLRLLAKYQGNEVNDWRDEQPGKIMHELRVGELAHLSEIPQTPYYGSVDSTPLFLILIARHANWTGDLSLFRELKQSIERALDWMTHYGDETGDGYLQYNSKSTKGLGNQGWKDSGDSIMNANGALAKPPIALVEVQGYVFLAKISLADLYERDGDRNTAEKLRMEADQLRARFERDFWLEDKGIYALALQAGKKPAAVVSSNPGQMLWSGIAQPGRAKKTVKHLMSPAMFSGWGVRTLSSQESRYNPVGYHLGTVWPHDNSIIAAGLRMYGFDQDACRIFGGITDAAQHFEHCRLPEVFAGFSRDEFHVPVRYPVACHPQAWAAGAVPFMIESLLGLMPKAFENRLHVVRPVLPEFINQLELLGLRVGKATVDLKFDQAPDRMATTHVIQIRGKLDVDVSAEGLNKAA
jgi:glycogen debranching enzyme